MEESYLVTGWVYVFGEKKELLPISCEFFDKEIRCSQDFEEVFEKGRKVIAKKFSEQHPNRSFSIDGIALWKKARIGGHWVNLEK